MYKLLSELASELTAIGYGSYAKKIISMATDEGSSEDNSAEIPLCLNANNASLTNETVDAVWSMLCPLLPRGARLTSGVRTDEWRRNEVIRFWRRREIRRWDREFDEQIASEPDDAQVARLEANRAILKAVRQEEVDGTSYSRSICNEVNKSTQDGRARGIACSDDGNHVRGEAIDIGGSDLDAIISAVNKLIPSSDSAAEELTKYVELAPWGPYCRGSHPEPHAPSENGNWSLDERCTSQPHIHVGIVKAVYNEDAEAALKRYLCSEYDRCRALDDDLHGDETAEVATPGDHIEEEGEVTADPWGDHDFDGKDTVPEVCSDPNRDEYNVGGKSYVYDQATQSYVLCSGAEPSSSATLPTTDEVFRTESGTWVYDSETQQYIKRD
tara:strand:+ start:16972 stop:18126 length:1155 start_codon:yes stop_codon:yes gene_type:complete